ncbi:MAG: hypothetical protein WCS84_11715 [Nocardioides sp.]
MAATKPRIGYQSIIWDNRNWITASSEDTDHAAELVANLQPGNWWSPAWAALTAAVYLYVYPVLGQLLGLNWYFRDWDAGTAAAPTGWTLSGTNATVAREAGAANIKIGAYSAALTRVGTDCCLYQAALDAEALRGLQCAGGAWIKASVASRAYVSIYDGSTRWTSSAHTGGGAFEWISVASAAIASGATSVLLEVWCKTGDTTIYIAGALLAAGSTATQTPHAVSCDYVAIHGHNLKTAGMTCAVEWSTDNFGTSTAAVSWAPTVDTTQWQSFTAVSKAFWRVKLVATGTYYQQPRIACLALGTALELPCWPVSGFDPYNRAPQVDEGFSTAGGFLGRSVKRDELRNTLRLECLTRAQFIALDAFRLHAYSNARPWWLSWNFGDYPAEAYYVRTPKGSRWSGPLDVGLLVRVVSLPYEGVAEA